MARNLIIRLSLAAAALGAVPAVQAQATQSQLPPVLAALSSQFLTRALGDGCWVRFYDDPAFRGRTVTLSGPTALERVQLQGRAWGDWDSVIVGPQAKLTVFDNRNFRDRIARLAPSERVSDLGAEKLGWREEIRSARVECMT